MSVIRLRQQQKTMDAAIFYGPNIISIKEIQIPSYDTVNGVLLKVDACAVCGYDVRVFRKGHSKVKPPVILGHEICGEILDTLIIPKHGDDRNKTRILKAGTRVAVCPIIPCLTCGYCLNNQYNLCINLKEIGSTVNGGFAEYVCIPSQTVEIGGLVEVPTHLSNEEAVLLEPLACCLNGYSQIGDIHGGTSIVILGDGPIGLLLLQISKNVYNAKTIIIGKIPARLQKARDLGADEIILFDDNSKEVAEKIKGFTDGIGSNIAIVATSSHEALKLATRIVRKNSKINIFAGMPKGTTLSIDSDWLHYNQISLTDSFSSTPAALREACKITSDKKIQLNELITHRFPVRNIEDAIDTTEKYYGLRTVINSFEKG